ncbi:hypothetical protein An06g01940 [Aspergillus niger]|uniref:Uncharacterized protein n=2 Tax=Aspergillus niger TaxID=5061 RepID=A2QLP2_ASPNC|nr:hypothetical protein An06g01940 [Aspergillus niger]CAK48037.1 hypothetical protein An06g01940 [Aspergillus niger]
MDTSPVPRLLRSSLLSPIRSNRAGSPERKFLHSSLSRRNSDVRVLRRLACDYFSPVANYGSSSQILTSANYNVHPLDNLLPYTDSSKPYEIP